MAVFLVDIAIPTFFEYFAIKDSGGTVWYFWFDEAGQLARGLTAPVDPGGLRPRDLSSSPIPDAIQVEDTAMVDWWLQPTQNMGELQALSSNPGGTIEDAGTGKTALSLEPGQPYTLGVDPEGFIIVTQETAVAASDSVLFSSGSVAPFFDARLWKAYLTTTVNIESTISAGGALIGGRAIPRFGNLDLAIGDGTQDTFLPLIRDGALVRVYEGNDNLGFGAFTEILNARVRSVGYDLDGCTIALGDSLALIDVPVQQNTYTTTDDLNGQPIPLAYGRCTNITPVLINRAELIYQVHERSIVNVLSVYDRGVPLDDGGDISNLGLGALSAWTPVPGQFVSDTNQGLFRVGAEPAGPLTADIDGDLGLGLDPDAPKLLRELATTQGGLADPGDIDTAAFSATTAANPSNVGLFISRQTPTIPQLCDQIMMSIGGYWGFTSLGKLTVGIVEIGTSSRTVVTEDIFRLERLAESPIPPWRIRVGYRRAWTTQEQEDLAAAAPTARKTLVQHEYRWAIANELKVQQRHALSQIIERRSLLIDQSAANDEAVRQLEMLGRVSTPDMWLVEVTNHQFQIQIGDTVTLQHSRFGLDAGKDFFVVGVVEDTDSDTTQLRVWG